MSEGLFFDESLLLSDKDITLRTEAIDQGLVIKVFIIRLLEKRNRFRGATSFYLEGIRVNLLIKDLVIFNVLSLLTALILFFLGRTLIDAVFISLLFFCALLLISGGAIGFLFSSVSFERIQKFFRGKKEVAQEQEKKRRIEEGLRKLEQVNTGKRIILIGLILLGESLLISLAFILL